MNIVIFYVIFLKFFLLVDFLEILPSCTTIQRTAGTGLVSELIAPLWVKNKFETQNKIDLILKERNSFQGIKYHLN